MATPTKGRSAADSEHHHREQVRQPGDGAEPGERLSAVAASNLNHKRDDDRGDHHNTGECRCVDVDLTEPLVAAVATKTADGLAAATEQEEGTETGHNAQRDDPALEVATDPHCDEHHRAEHDGKGRQIPLGLSDLHRRSPQQGDRSTSRGPGRAATTGYNARSRSS